MRYRSTNPPRRAECSLLDAVLRGVAPDGGLYVPDTLPLLPGSFLERIRSFSFADISFEISCAILGDDVPEAILREIVDSALTFPVPLVRLSEPLSILELFHGPTLAFKDFGARFMARLMAYLVRESGRLLTVLVATSGDTGGAVAHAYLGVPGIRVVILYPSGRVSDAQEKQLTTLDQNITALEVAGTFDDCQKLVKQALADSELNEKLLLSSANSINIARLIPQMFYYFAGYAQLAPSSTSIPAGAVPTVPDEAQVIFSVPSGNFGNLTAGLMAKRIGLPAARLIAATNVNDVVPEFLRSGAFLPRLSLPTLSTAMDIGNPSNFARMFDLYDGDLAAMRKDIWGCSVTDDETRRTMREIYERCGYLLDPHTAVGVAAWEAFQKQHRLPHQGIVLATAHPAKFADVVERATGVRPAMPESLTACLAKPKRALPLPDSFAAFKEFLLS